MNLDITFCSYFKCENLSCERNQNNLIKLVKYGEIELNHPISVTSFEECEYWR